MKRPLLLLLLVLLQLQSYDFVGAKEEQEKSGKDGEKKKEEEKEMGENGEKRKEVKDEEEEKEMKEDMEDTCLSSPCGAHARCKNVQVPKSTSSSSPHGMIIIMVVKMVITFMVMITLS